mmetsp:Transcript_45929/g.133726  ORF Transcript_45929/g.133726 Transcript_45929/m.133726 type:complete len:283 (-) Transcript_45929:258-1106(-)
MECCSMAPTSSGNFMPQTPHLATPKVSRPRSHSSGASAPAPSPSSPSASVAIPGRTPRPGFSGEAALTDNLFFVGPAETPGESSMGKTFGSLLAFVGVIMLLTGGRGVISSNTCFPPSLPAGLKTTSFTPTASKSTSSTAFAAAAIAASWPLRAASFRMRASRWAMTSRRNSNCRSSLRKSRIVLSMSSSSAFASCHWRRDSSLPLALAASAAPTAFPVAPAVGALWVGEDAAGVSTADVASGPTPGTALTGDDAADVAAANTCVGEAASIVGEAAVAADTN